MIELKNLSYTYDDGATAVVDVTANLGPGLYLLLGENGAGKTTLLHLLTGLRYPTSGTVTVDGEDVTQRKPSMYQHLFFAPESLEVPARTIREFASIHSSFYPGFSEEAFTANLAEFGMTGNEKLSGLSFGTGHKAVLAYILALGCNTLLLDEPANGLDINSRKSLRSMLARSMNDDSTVVVSTHTVADFELLFDGVIVMHHGRIVLCASTSHIASRLRFDVSNLPAENALYFEQELGTVHSISPNTDGVDTDVDFGLLYSALLSPAGAEIVSLLNS